MSVAELAADLDVPGVAVGVVMDGTETFTYHGVTSVENPLPVDETTLFQIGSITKTYTATLIMHLVQLGEVDLDAPVRRYVPELKLANEAAEHVTVLQLLNHTAGWAGDFFSDTGDGDDALARHVDELAEIAFLGPPGSLVSYNNNSFGVAGRLIEKVTQLTFEAALEQVIIRPLGLESSHIFPKDVMTCRFAVGHIANGRSNRIARPWCIPRRAHPAGGIVSTARDVVRYARFHLSEIEGPLAPELCQLMQRPTYEIGGGSLGDAVGISWFIRDIGGARVVGHEGITNGQLASLQLVPERGFAVVVLTNARSGGQLHRRLVHDILNEYLGIRPDDPQPFSVTEAQIDSLSGRYASPQATITVAVDGGRLGATWRLRAQALPERVRDALREANEASELPALPAVSIQPISAEEFLILDGPDRGMKGRLLQSEEGELTAIDFDGRLFFREEGKE